MGFATVDDHGEGRSNETCSGANGRQESGCAAGSVGAVDDLARALHVIALTSDALDDRRVLGAKQLNLVHDIRLLGHERRQMRLSLRDLVLEGQVTPQPFIRKEQRQRKHDQDPRQQQVARTPDESLNTLW